MEREGKFHRYRRHSKPSATTSDTNALQANNHPTDTLAGSSSNGGAPAEEAAGSQQNQNGVEPPPTRPTPCVVREQDQYMPIANVIRIMRRILPTHAKISDDAKETIQECVSEYISFITGEANDRCQKEQRKTITAEDILWSMGKLGFDEYVEPLTLFLNRYREAESDRSSSRDSILKRSSAAARAADYGMNHCMLLPPPSQQHFGQAYNPMLPPLPLIPAAAQNMFDGGIVGGGYYKDPTEFDVAAAGNFGGAGNIQNPNQVLPFDPFSQFK